MHSLINDYYFDCHQMY